MSEKEVSDIIKRVIDGEQHAFSLIVDEYKNLVYSLCLKMMKNTQDAEEIAQEAFVKAYKGMNNFRGQSKFSTWLYQLTYYTAVSELRKTKIETKELNHEYEDRDETILEEIKREEQGEYINKALEYLKPTERAIICLYYFEEESMEDISKITNLSVSNVKVKIHRTRKKLYGILSALLKSELTTLIE